ncbi:oxidoreductase-like protein [Elsinoe ampelina]|uniref:Oxidoreductase-like protein n=1 Tax=Elsinoe ampelina TaxID=302913 RepID=A0A6A6GIC8_9PEZI|nr:oxidoreductase-like protein [Elsinoe ampelina]
MTTNRAAWLLSKGAYPFTLDSSELPQPEADEVVIKNHALAINPIDWKVQGGYAVDKFPVVLGGDVAGEIHSVGASVKGLKVGDRVFGQTTYLTNGKITHGGFQHFTAVPTTVVSKIPDNISYSEASVLPIAASTAMVGLYSPDHLGLPLPSLDPKDSGKVIIIWGGSSSVGATAIQLAKASGVSVITTASVHNHEFVKATVGATAAFDHRSPTVVDDIVKAVKSSGKEFAGIYDSISLKESAEPIGSIFHKLGDSNKKLATVLTDVQGLPDDIKPVFVFSLEVLSKYKDVADHVWGKFLYKGLEAGSIKPLPEPLIVGKGLESVQKAVDKNKEGVSAKKVVVEL